MTQLIEQENSYLANFRQFQQAAPNGQPWLEQLRRAGMDRFSAVGFPSSKTEEWRHTNLAPIARTSFTLASGSDTIAPERLSPFTLGRLATAELVFLNGHFSPQLSKLTRLPKGVTILSLAEAIQRDGALLQQHLGKYARLEENPFVALNTAFLNDGAFVHVERGTKIEQPIHLLFLSTADAQAAEPAVAHVRNLILIDDGAVVPILETYAGLGQGVYFANAVTELVAGVEAQIDHCKMQQESLDAFHVATMQVRLDRGADLVSHSATIGGRLTRNDLNVTLDGPFAHATVNGLVLIGGQQHCDNHTLLRHEKPNCPSHELYKYVLDGKATGVFRGKIFVQKDAQKTDSKQTSKSLLLSDEAYMNAQPALEIYADDVKCTHGSTIGPVDEEMVFYLRSRGVPLDAARHLLTYAFAADVTRRIRIAPVRQRLEDFLAAQHGLPQDLRITDLGSHDEAAL